MMIKMRVNRTGQLKQLALTTAQYRQLGDRMVGAMKKRIGRAVNAEGAPARPLSAKYRKIKAKATGQSRPKRDMKLTGLTMGSYQVVRAWGGVIKAEPQGSLALRRAFFAQQLEPMFGFTPHEEKAVVAEARKMFGRNARLMWEER